MKQEVADVGALVVAQGMSGDEMPDAPLTIRACEARQIPRKDVCPRWEQTTSVDVRVPMPTSEGRPVCVKKRASWQEWGDFGDDEYFGDGFETAMRVGLTQRSWLFDEAHETELSRACLR